MLDDIYTKKGKPIPEEKSPKEGSLLRGDWTAELNCHTFAHKFAAHCHLNPITISDPAKNYPNVTDCALHLISFVARAKALSGK